MIYQESGLTDCVLRCIAAQVKGFRKIGDAPAVVSVAAAVAWSPQVMGEYLRFLRALLGASDESLHNIRFRDAANVEHMRHFPAMVRQLWEVGARDAFLYLQQ